MPRKAVWAGTKGVGAVSMQLSSDAPGWVNSLGPSLRCGMWDEMATAGLWTSAVHRGWAKEERLVEEDERGRRNSGMNDFIDTKEGRESRRKGSLAMLAMLLVCIWCPSGLLPKPKMLLGGDGTFTRWGLEDR